MTPILTLSLQEYIEVQNQKHLQNKVEDYAHPADSAVIKVLETLIGQTVMEEAIRYRMIT